MSEADTTQLVESQETIPVYLYGILPSQTELPADLTGINDGEVELVIHGALAAVVTVLPPMQKLARRIIYWPIVRSWMPSPCTHQYCQWLSAP
ncbi:MAG TPA: GvpL/GvpF family gas vesicle protein [Candidatus Yaniella excrementigallinarum]|nr:GvpL/GvpF family gas vesicle protein [Candidatus Yaniella excrementigallinarum]